MKVIKVKYDEEVHGQERDWIERKHDVYISDNLSWRDRLNEIYKNYNNVKITVEIEWRLTRVNGYLIPINDSKYERR